MYKSQRKGNTRFALPIVYFQTQQIHVRLIPFLDEIENHYFVLPKKKHIDRRCSYGSETNYNDILSNRKNEEALITFNLYLKEQKKKYKQNPLTPDNWQYCEEKQIPYICPNQERLDFTIINLSVMTVQDFNEGSELYECEDCSGCPFRSYVQKS